ncbi:MAG: hypothetical protein RMI88_04960, partial [Nitrososphaerota archaeon]|nr:hypothetical protein [Nitrososphaerota archaeon]
ANTPIKLSWSNKVYWFCPESRYRYFRSHDWVDYDEAKFKGMFFRVYDLDELLNALRLAQINYRRMFYDPHEKEEFKDDDD